MMSNDLKSIESEQVAIEGNEYPRATFARRFAAMIYDALVAIAVGMLAALIMSSLLTVVLEQGWLPKFGYEHVSDAVQASLVYQGILQIWSGFWIAVFFLWFWKNGGQTLGMRAWRLRIFNRANTEVSYARLMLRLVTSVCGLGTLWVLIRYKQKLGIQDIIAKTEVLYLSKEANDHKRW